MYKLIIYDEKGAAREFDLLQGICHLGRSKKNDIYLNDQRISRSHAQIQLDPDGRIFIEDLDSKEGTTVNGKSIHKKTELKDGDEIAISSFTIEVKKWMEEMGTVAMNLSKAGGVTPFSESGTDMGPDGTIAINLDNPDDAKLPKYHKLLIISDKRFGEEYVLDKPALIIGSLASRCDIVIDDKKVSDEHARLVVSDGECVLENLAAAKETLVNGKHAKKNIPLKKGDCIKIGSVLLRFIDKDEVVQKEELESLAKPKGLEKNKKKTILIGLAIMSAILVLMVLFKPQKGPSKPKAGQGTVSTEAAKIKKAPEEIPDSVKQELEQIPDTEIAKKKAPAATEVESSILEKKLIAKTVSNANEKEGKKLIESAIEDYLIGKTNNAFNKLNAVLKLDLKNETLLKKRASNLLADLKNILGFFHNGHTEYNNNQIDKAFDTWSKGLVLEKRVIGKKISHDSKSIRDIIADREAREARKAFESGDFPAAHKFSEKALTIYPKHEDSLEISNLLSVRAKKLYKEGYIIKDLNPDQAVLKMKEVLSITSTDSEYYKKANSIIAGITGTKH